MLADHGQKLSARSHFWPARISSGVFLVVLACFQHLRLNCTGILPHHARISRYPAMIPPHPAAISPHPVAIPQYPAGRLPYPGGMPRYPAGISRCLRAIPPSPRAIPRARNRGFGWPHLKSADISAPCFDATCRVEKSGDVSPQSMEGSSGSWGKCPWPFIVRLPVSAGMAIFSYPSAKSGEPGWTAFCIFHSDA